MFLWIVLLLVLGSYCYYLSRLQPFPEKGSRFSMLLFTGALILWIASTSPEGSEKTSQLRFQYFWVECSLFLALEI